MNPSRKYHDIPPRVSNENANLRNLVTMCPPLHSGTGDIQTLAVTKTERPGLVGLRVLENDADPDTESLNYMI